MVATTQTSKFINVAHVSRRLVRGTSAFFLSFMLLITLSQPAFAATPTDYSWMRNMGASGCQEYGFSPRSLAISGSTIYVTGTDHVAILTTSGASTGQFGVAGPSNGQFSNPLGLTTSSTGDIYVADTSNNRIQVFNPDHTYKAQFGTSGSGNGQLSFPSDVTVASTGDIYVTDTGNNRVQIFNPDYTYKAQFGTSGSGNGQLSFPSSVSINASGEVYAVDNGNSRVQVFTLSGVYQSQFGTSGSGDGQFNFSAMGSSFAKVAFNSTGDIYVADLSNNRIQVFNPDGTYKSQFGSFGSGDGQFRSTRAVAFDAAGDIYVADFSNNRIQVFNPDGTYKSQMAYVNPNAPTVNSLCSPTGVAHDTAGNIYVSDVGWSNVKVYSSSGVLLRVIGGPGSGNGQLNDPQAVAIGPNNHLYVADRLNRRVVEFTVDGQFVRNISVDIFSSIWIDVKVTNLLVTEDALYVTSNFFTVSGPSTYRGFLARYDLATGAQDWALADMTGTTGADYRFAGLALDATGNLRALHIADNVVQTYHPLTGAQLPDTFGSYGTGNGQLSTVGEMTTDPDHSYFIADNGNNRIEVFDASGQYLTQFGASGSGDGQLSNPQAVTIGSDGTVYVADYNNKRISVWAPHIIPSAPESLGSANGTTATGALVSWTAPARVGALPYTYTVQYRVAGATTWATAVADLPSATTSYNFTGLQPGRTYEVRVLAVNVLGASTAASYSFVMPSEALANTGVSTLLYTFVGISAVIIGGFGLIRLLRGSSSRQ